MTTSGRSPTLNTKHSLLPPFQRTILALARVQKRLTALIPTPLMTRNCREKSWQGKDKDDPKYRILEGLAPCGGQTSSSCGGLVAFGHQMGVLWAPRGPSGPGGPSGPLGALRAPWTNRNTYIAQTQILIHI